MVLYYLKNGNSLLAFRTMEDARVNGRDIVQVTFKKDGNLDDGNIVYCAGNRDGFSSIEAAVEFALATHSEVTIRYATNIGATK